MIQNYKRLQLQIEAINSININGAQIQKIYSSSRYICWQLRSAGKTHYLYMGRGKGHEGVWLGAASIQSTLRVKDKFLDYLRSHMTNKRVHWLEIDAADRIIRISLAPQDGEGFMFFYKGRELYFGNYQQKNENKQFFQSWTGDWVQVEKVDYLLFDEIGRVSLEVIDANENTDISQLLENEYLAQKAILAREVQKLNKKKYRKIEKIRNDLVKVEQWKKLVELVEKDDLSQAQKKSEFFGIKFKFIKEGHYARRSQIFEKIKNFQAAEILLNQRLAAEEMRVNKSKTELKGALKPLAPVWNSKAKSKKEVVTREVEYKVFHYSDFDVGVGQNAKGNDQLRNSWGKKEDIWVHVDQDTSAHAVIKLKNRSAQIVDILDQIKGHFKKNGELDLVYTKLKFVKSIKGSAGKVQITKEKRVRFVND